MSSVALLRCEEYYLGISNIESFVQNCLVCNLVKIQPQIS